MSANTRLDRLANYLGAVLHGKQEVKNLGDFKRFIEAILNQQNPSVTIERLATSHSALSALHKGLRFNLTPAFINEYTSKFIKFLNNPDVKLLCNGLFQQQLLQVMLEPRSLWNALVDAFHTRTLDQDAIHTFCWLVTEILSLPASYAVDITADVQTIISDDLISSSSSASLRNLGHKMKYLLEMKSSASALLTSEHTAGGRHDNDFSDFRKIAILPTADEMSCTENPFYRRADEISQLSGNRRIAAHVDNQFRLLREDMLSGLRDDIQVARGTKKGRRSALRLQGLSLARVSCVSADLRYLHPCTVGVTAKSGLNRLESLSKEDKKIHLKQNPDFIRHHAFGCFLRDTEIVAFATIERSMDDLISTPPIVMLKIAEGEALKKCILFLKLYDDVEFLVVDSPTFAYEPILKCLQERTDFPLTKELFLYEKDEPVKESSLAPWAVIQELKEEYRRNIQHILRTSRPITLDPSQLDSLLKGLTQSLSLIQGPPGTGKSFIGALLAKVLHDHTNDKILVMCYTNHALDQFLEDLLDIGIDGSHIVRLGSKSSPRTQSLSLKEQKLPLKRSQTTWNTINSLRSEGDELKNSLNESFTTYQAVVTNSSAILEYLEFEEPAYFEAFTVPESDGMNVVGKDGKVVNKNYLYHRWVRGQSPEPFSNMLPAQCRGIWAAEQRLRDEKIQSWKRALLTEQAASLAVQIKLFDKCQEKLSGTLGERTREILKRKQIIGCTTTAAAMFSKDIRNASPGIVLLEEAGEILESHVLTAISPQTKHLVMIGDHLQLRPKVNSYALSLEKGDGYDLNVSLFERLIHKEYPHTTLLKQHRMCPEISSLVRSLTYPGLEDDEKTRNRPDPRGLCDRVIFFNHLNAEESFADISDRRDEGAKQSKKNIFEAEIVLKIVKYLGQQGYGTDKLVVLTPYLGQLLLLKQTLSKQNDPVLNDLDSYDLVQAGLLSQASADHSKRPIKLSTIDNYQGEESDIVIASLTRSNKKGDIGFMAAAERLNVLLSRARNILIIVGNSKTFVSSQKGRNTWRPLIDQLKANGHLYDGLPVRCEQHPDKTVILRTKEDFETESPDGGCAAPCGVKLSCGIHECPSKCHQLVDHSKMLCTKIVKWNCPRGHSLSVSCSKIKGACRFCNHEDVIRQQKRDRDQKLETDRQKKQAAYAQELAELQDEASHLRRLRGNILVDAEQAKVIKQYRDEIEALRSPAKPGENMDSAQSGEERATSPISHVSVTTEKSKEYTKSPIDEPRKEIKVPDAIPTQAPSEAKSEWEYQKTYHNSQSLEIDQLMDMVGLESVKGKFLEIKQKVDLTIRQNIDLSCERYGTVLLGNPGTGKTTVARLYAKFLAAVGIIPGSKFIETTGSRLSNEGISQCQKTIESLLKDGGGVIFIDEAYQLVQAKSSGGSQVLDFLLAEVENLTGKIVFILAGYRRQMEHFFAHNPGLPSRFPHELNFEDFNDTELMLILEHWIEKTYKKRMKIDDGPGGLYCRIVARRIGRGRGKDGFANARAVENVVTKITERQAKRIAQERRKGSAMVNDFFLDKQDMIGPDPSQMLKSSNAWQKLQGLVGLNEVKRTVEELIDTVQYNYRRELSEQPLTEYSLNKVFLGSPGTGKTSVAKLYGQILVDIGLLSNGEVIVKNPSDFVGSVIGESEKNTKGILAATLGKVLVIDEAYGLFAGGSSDSTGAKSDIYRSAIVDTIVAEVQSTPGDDRCVILLGYKDQMQEMFQNVNPGLSRRFPIDQAFVFEDFTQMELDMILDLKLREQGYKVTDRARRVVLEMLERARNRLHFGNAGEIDNLLNAAKMHHQRRLSLQTIISSVPDAILDAVDFDENYDRAEKSNNSVSKMFEGVVGCENITSKLEGYQKMVKNLKRLNMDPLQQVPFNFVFRGPPGTGKTSTARKMGQVYYDMGLLASTEVIEASATELVGQYVGQTGPKTQHLLERGLGKVLFIDEAYRLAEGQFAKEAMDELVDCITKPKFARKLIIILAGYDADINRLMSINPGLTSRFPESLQFEPLSLRQCIQLLEELLSKQKRHLLEQSRTEFDISCMQCSDPDLSEKLTQGFDTLSKTASWANARDVETLATAIFRKTVTTIQDSSTRGLILSRDSVIEEIQNMITERHGRENFQPQHPLAKANRSSSFTVPLRTQNTNPPMINTQSQTAKSNTVSDAKIDRVVRSDLPGQNVAVTDQRDDDVTDDVWAQLEKDKAMADAKEKEFLRVTHDEQQQKRELQKLQDEENRSARETAEPKRREDEEARNRYEQERLRHELERRLKEAIARDLAKKRKTLIEARRKEQANQEKLRQMGVCVMGYRWIKQSGGYRCAGGSHWVSDAQLH